MKKVFLALAAVALLATACEQSTGSKNQSVRLAR